MLTDIRFYIMTAKSKSSFDVVLINNQQNLDSFVDYINNHPEIEAIRVTPQKAYSKLLNKYELDASNSCFIYEENNTLLKQHIQGEFKPLHFLALINAVGGDLKAI